ncbi:MAG TPA: YajG family lipoprotein [Alphaproteobacteria bacterium]|nr:YajG family lipoprotein [Alphaproteobacteria bacterium]
MKNTALFAILAAIGILLPACALTPQQLHLEPTVAVKSEPVASGTTVAVSIEDRRTDSKLGEVGDPNTQMVEVSLTEDFKPRLYEEVRKVLTGLGFTVVPAGEEADHSLQIDVRRLELSSVKQPFVFDTELRAELGAVATNGPDTYDRLYYVRTRKETAGPPYLKDSNALINTAVSQALQDMLSDERLLDVLTR